MKDKELLELIKSRRSIRKFKDIPIQKKDIEDMITAGIFAPSGSNTQCYRFIIITNKEDIKFLAKAKIPIVANAQTIILVLADLNSCTYLKTERKEIFSKLPYQDCGMAIENIILMAQSKGISSCVIHLSEKWHSANEIANRFNLNWNYELQGLILLGYSDEIVDYKTATHAGKPIKRKEINKYILNWRT